MDWVGARFDSPPPPSGPDYGIDHGLPHEAWDLSVGGEEVGSVTVRPAKGCAVALSLVVWAGVALATATGVWVVWAVVTPVAPSSP